jgi:hypothetical protein
MNVMKRMANKVKRKYGLSTHLNHYGYFHSRKKGNGPRTFKTEEAAHLWAETNGLKKEQYTLKKVKKNKKFQVVRNNGKNKDDTA